MNMGKWKEKTAGVKDAALEKINQSLADFSEAIPAIKDLGFAVTNVRIRMGLTPEISAKLTGTVASIKKEKVQKLIESYPENKFLVTILKGLQTASEVQNKIGDLGFKGLEADVNLVPPTIDVDFLDK